MNVVWKYTILAKDVQSFKIPIGAKLLTVQLQDNDIQLWALVNPSKPTETRTIETVPTGREIEDKWRKYIGTVQIDSLVFHFFEI